jgi:hypothetical protein
MRRIASPTIVNDAQKTQANQTLEIDVMSFAMDQIKSLQYTHAKEQQHRAEENASHLFC